MKISKKTRVFIIYVIVFILAALLIGYLFFYRSIIEGASTADQTATKAIRDATGSLGKTDATFTTNLTALEKSTNKTFQTAGLAIKALNTVISGIKDKKSTDISEGYKNLTGLFTGDRGTDLTASMKTPTNIDESNKYSVATFVYSTLETAKSLITSAAFLGITEAKETADKINDAKGPHTILPLPSDKSYPTSLSDTQNAARKLTNNVDKPGTTDQADIDKANGILKKILDGGDKQKYAANATVSTFNTVKYKLIVEGTSKETGILPKNETGIPKLKSGYDITSIVQTTTALTTLSGIANNSLSGVKISPVPIDAAKLAIFSGNK
jgi:hypothetical protein